MSLDLNGIGQNLSAEHDFTQNATAS